MCPDVSHNGTYRDRVKSVGKIDATRIRYAAERAGGSINLRGILQGALLFCGMHLAEGFQAETVEMDESGCGLVVESIGFGVGGKFLVIERVR